MSESLADIRYEATQNRIVAIAERVFAEHGLRHTSMAAIAEEVGIGRAALYHYFSSKDALVDAAIEVATARVASFPELPESARFREGISYLVTRVAHLMVHSGTDLRFLLVAMTEELGAPPEEQRIRKAIDAFRTAARDVLRKGIATGDVRADLNIDHAADRLFSSIFGLELLWLVDNDFAFEESAAELEEDFVRSVAPDGRQ